LNQTALTFVLSLQSFELNWIAALQADGEFRRIMTYLSYLGSEAFEYVLPFTYFVLSRSAGARLYLLFSTSSSLLETLKMTFHLPRPYWLDPRIRALSESGNYGMPSGHALGASLVWPLLGRSIGTRWSWALAMTIVFLVSASRVYLGAHFISDVVGAWIVAAGLVGGFDWIEGRSRIWLHSISISWQLGCAAVGAIALIAAGTGVHLLIAGVADAPSWAKFSANARDLNGLFYSSGEFFGAAIGLILAGRWAKFDVSIPLWKRGFALGYALIGARLFQELGALMPAFPDETLRFFSKFLQGIILNFWMLFLAPWILLKINVLQTDAGRTPCAPCRDNPWPHFIHPNTRTRIRPAQAKEE
jgi:membrane-associated phospholipid phosphatase